MRRVLVLSSLVLAAGLIAASISAQQQPAREQQGVAMQPALRAAPARPRSPRPPPAQQNPLLDPARANTRAPATFAVKLTTTKGEVFIDVTRAWSPNGADRFYNLVRLGYYNDTAFFRVIQGFMAQIGIHGDPQVNLAWRGATINDDPANGQSNRRGMVTFAKTGMPNSRTTQIFINLVDNANLDSMGFTPFGRVRDMSVMDQVFSGYGEGAPGGRGPSQGRITSEGNAYLRQQFPQLDYIQRAELVQGNARSR